MPLICENYLLDIFTDMPQPDFWDKETKAVNDYPSEMKFIKSLSEWEQKTGIFISAFGPAGRVLYGKKPGDDFFDLLLRTGVSPEYSNVQYGMRSWWISNSSGLQWASYRPKFKGFVMFTFTPEQADSFIRSGSDKVFYPIVRIAAGFTAVFVLLFLLWFYHENKKKKNKC